VRGHRKLWKPRPCSLLKTIANQHWIAASTPSVTADYSRVAACGVMAVALITGRYQMAAGNGHRLVLDNLRHDQDRDIASLVRRAGRCGRSGPFAWFGIAQLVSTAAWPIAILGSASLGAGLGWPGYRLWRTPAASDVVVSDKPIRG
jgi:hypothetical protein